MNKLEWFIFSCAIALVIFFAAYVGVDEGRKRQWAEDEPILKRAVLKLTECTNDFSDFAQYCKKNLGYCASAIEKARKEGCNL
jgi:hypothetical protein